VSFPQTFAEHVLLIQKYLSMGYYGAWPMMVIWGLERFLRLVRIIAYNFAYFNPFASKPTLDATVDLFSEQVLRVTTHRPSYFHWRPGQSAFLSFPSITSFPFQSHPFTIATIDEADGTFSGEKKLVFLIRVRNGFTKKLMLVASSDRTYKIFINGPYSSPPVLVGYETIILIAGWFLSFFYGQRFDQFDFIGGSGVTFTLPLFLDVMRWEPLSTIRLN
jgi:predicted ferric reductase